MLGRGGDADACSVISKLAASMQGSLADEVGQGAAAVDQDARSNHALCPQLHAVLNEGAQGRQPCTSRQHYHWGPHVHGQPEAHHLHRILGPQSQKGLGVKVSVSQT